MLCLFNIIFFTLWGSPPHALKKRKEKELANLPNKTRKLKAAMMIYTAWNIWKERNRRVFNQQFGLPIMVIQEIKGEISDRRLACGGPELSFVNNV